MKARVFKHGPWWCVTIGQTMVRTGSWETAMGYVNKYLGRWNP